MRSQTETSPALWPWLSTLHPVPQSPLEEHPRLKQISFHTPSEGPECQQQLIVSHATERAGTYAFVGTCETKAKHEQQDVRPDYPGGSFPAQQGELLRARMHQARHGKE